MPVCAACGQGYDPAEGCAVCAERGSLERTGLQLMASEEGAPPLEIDDETTVILPAFGARERQGYTPLPVATSVTPVGLTTGHYVPVSDRRAPYRWAVIGAIAALLLLISVMVGGGLAAWREVGSGASERQASVAVQAPAALVATPPSAEVEAPLAEPARPAPVRVEAAPPLAPEVVPPAMEAPPIEPEAPTPHPPKAAQDAPPVRQEPEPPPAPSSNPKDPEPSAGDQELVRTSDLVDPWG